MYGIKIIDNVLNNTRGELTSEAYLYLKYHLTEVKTIIRGLNKRLEPADSIIEEMRALRESCPSYCRDKVDRFTDKVMAELEKQIRKTEAVMGQNYYRTCGSIPFGKASFPEKISCKKIRSAFYKMTPTSTLCKLIAKLKKNKYI